MRLLKHHAARLTALAVAVGLYPLAQLPSVPALETGELAARYRFSQRVPLVEEAVPARTFRAVSPALRRHRSWISSVGAAVALADIDGDGLANDICLVDPRTDLVTVRPLPTTGARFKPQALMPLPINSPAAATAPMGCVPSDINEDGRMDLLVYYWGRTPVAFLRDGLSFTPREVVRDQERWYTNAATFADVDGDGHADLIVGNYFPDGARILDETSSEPEAMQASMSDAQNGGSKRILLWERPPSGSSLDVSFTESVDAIMEEARHGWTLAIGAADLDHDGLPEIYIANDFGPDRLLKNESTPGSVRLRLARGERSLLTPKSSTLGRDSYKGMGVDFADINGDGDLDILVSNIAVPYGLLESHFCFLSTGEEWHVADGGELRAPFVNASEDLSLSRGNWGWDIRADDFDNDGSLEIVQASGFVRGTTQRWPELQELAMANDGLLHSPAAWLRVDEGDDLSGQQFPNVFARTHGGRYVNVAADVGLGDIQVTRGIATGDVDGNGSVDLVLANQWEQSWLYLNESPHAGSFLGLHVLLPLDPSKTHVEVHDGHPTEDWRGRPAVGAEIVVGLPSGRRLIRQVHGGNGHSGVRSPDVHFGLGEIDAEARLPVEISWRTPEGVSCQQSVAVTPGWHVVLLPWRCE